MGNLGPSFWRAALAHPAALVAARLARERRHWSGSAGHPLTWNKCSMGPSIVVAPPQLGDETPMPIGWLFGGDLQQGWFEAPLVVSGLDRNIVRTVRTAGDASDYGRWVILG